MPRRALSFFDEKRPILKARTEWGFWWQTVQEVHIQVNLPEGVKSKEIKLEVKPKYIKCVVQGRTIFEGALTRIVYAEETVWTLEDGVLCILLAKADFTVKDEIWESLLENGGFRADPWTLHGMRKDHDLEKFQIENPGMDFSRAKLAKNYDKLPGWSAERLAELKRRSEEQASRTQATATQTLADLRRCEGGNANGQWQTRKMPATATQTLADVNKNGESSGNSQEQAPKTPATATETLADVMKKSQEGGDKEQGEASATQAMATQTPADTKKNGEESGNSQEQAPKTPATATQTLADLKDKTKEGSDEEQAPETQATPTQALSDLKKKCKERRDMEEQGPETQATATQTLNDLKKKKTEESGDKVQE